MSETLPAGRVGRPGLDIPALHRSGAQVLQVVIQLVSTRLDPCLSVGSERHLSAPKGTPMQTRTQRLKNRRFARRCPAHNSPSDPLLLEPLAATENMH